MRGPATTRCAPLDLCGISDLLGHRLVKQVTSVAIREQEPRTPSISAHFRSSALSKDLPLNCLLDLPATFTEIYDHSIAGAVEGDAFVLVVPGGCVLGVLGWMSASVDHSPPRQVVSSAGEDLSDLAGADVYGVREVAVGHNPAGRDFFDLGARTASVLSCPVIVGLLRLDAAAS